MGCSIDQQYQLRRARQRPLVAVVTHGEVRVLAKRNGWGDAKLAALLDALDNLVITDINHPFGCFRFCLLLAPMKRGFDLNCGHWRTGAPIHAGGDVVPENLL